jgi:hypothetical protein
MDLAKLVASEGSKSKSPYEDLAFKIGALGAAGHAWGQSQCWSMPTTQQCSKIQL